MKLLFLTAILLSMHQGNFIYEEWLEANPENYCGEYAYADFSNYDGEVYVMQYLYISADNDSLKIIYKEETNTKENFREIQLPNPVISMSQLAVQSWEGVIKENLVGKFVLRYPPCNAKGKVVKGLLIGDRFFEKIDDKKL